MSAFLYVSIFCVLLYVYVCLSVSLTACMYVCISLHLYIYGPPFCSKCVAESICRFSLTSNGFSAMDSDGNQLYLTFRRYMEPATTLHRVDLTWKSSPNDLKRMMGAKLGIPPERLVLSYYPDMVGILRGHDPFWSSTLKNGDPITYDVCPIPEGFDIIDECHACGDLTHLFKDISRNQELAVPYRCEACSRKFYVTVGSLSAATVHRVELTSISSPNDLKRHIGAKLGIPPERLALSGPTTVGILRGEEPFRYTALKTGDHVTYLERPIPEGFDIIGECDGCGDIGHLFYGYARLGPKWEPVVEYCVACGGRKETPWESDSD